MISREAERALLESFHAGNETARVELIESHRGYVRHLAKKFANRCRDIEIEDLEQIGLIKLWEVIPRFSLSSDVALRSFAKPAIIGAMQKALTSQRNIRVPEGAFRSDATREYAARACGSLSINMPSPDGSGELGDNLAELSIVDDETDQPWPRDPAAIDEAANHVLTIAECIVFNGITSGGDKESLGSLLGVTPKRVSAIQESAQNRLKCYFTRLLLMGGHHAHG